MKENRLKFKRINWNMLYILEQWRKEKNDMLTETKLFCNLRPDKRVEPCCFCEHYTLCHHYRWEREYIHKNEEMGKERIRQKRKNKNKMKN